MLASDPDWIGSKYNVQVEWETGETTFEPLSIIADDDPVTCAAYVKESDLLALEGWHRFRNLAKKDKVLARGIKQSKIRQVRRSQTYMFVYLIPRNYMEAMQFDSDNKNSKWYDAIKMEMESMREYKVFKKWDKAILDKHKKVMNSPKGNQRIKIHLVFAVKFDGRHKARLVANGHLTPEPIENIYPGLVSLRNLRGILSNQKSAHTMHTTRTTRLRCLSSHAFYDFVDRMVHRVNTPCTPPNQCEPWREVGGSSQTN